MTDAKEFQLVAVSERAKRAREPLAAWQWVEPTVWTERMLTALLAGVKGGVWYSLMDKVHPERALLAAYSRVAANKGAAGVDHVTVAMFEERLDENLKSLSDALRMGTYRPQAIRRHYIPKPGSQERRPQGIPTVRDRVVQTALRQVLEPIFERAFASHSYGFRPGRGCKDALRRVEELLNVILCRSAEAAARALAVVQEWTASAGLTLHPSKTRVIDTQAESFDFLGYRFEGGTRRPRPKSLDKFKETVREKTSRTSGGSLRAIIARLNPTLRGWFEYFKHSHKWTFERLDGWIRMRLRSILRKRMKKDGRGRGTDHQRWTNAFFADHGLFSLKAAHELASQSSSR